MYLYHNNNKSNKVSYFNASTIYFSVTVSDTYVCYTYTRIKVIR